MNYRKKGNRMKNMEKLTKSQKFKKYMLESRKNFIYERTNGFAYELYLLNKFNQKQEIDIRMQLFEYLNIGFILTDKEEKN